MSQLTPGTPWSAIIHEVAGARIWLGVTSQISGETGATNDRHVANYDLARWVDRRVVPVPVYD